MVKWRIEITLTEVKATPSSSVGRQTKRATGQLSSLVELLRGFLTFWVKGRPG